MVIRRLKHVGAWLTLGMLALAFFLGLQYLNGNFHESIPGELYRSAQLNKGDLTRYSKRYHIASVLNLRGPNQGNQWYDDEKEEASRLHITHIDFAMKSSRELTNDQAMQLMEVMRNAPKPLLIHCHAGADRTGLAAAIYFAGIAKRSEWASERQMWLMYGHLPFWFNSSFAMNRTFERLEPLFGFYDS